MQGFVPLAAKRARARLPRHYVQRHLAERSGTAGALGAGGTGAVDAPINSPHSENKIRLTAIVRPLRPPNRSDDRVVRCHHGQRVTPVHHRSVREGDKEELHAYPRPAKEEWKMVVSRLRSFSTKRPLQIFSTSRSKGPRTSTSSISPSLPPKKSRKVPFGLRPSLTHTPSITRRTPTAA